MLSLGNMYSFGEGVPQNDVQAHVWFNLTASRETGFLRDTAITLRDQIAARMTADQRAEAARANIRLEPTTLVESVPD